jgi:hypothetical protein
MDGHRCNVSCRGNSIKKHSTICLKDEIQATTTCTVSPHLAALQASHTFIVLALVAARLALRISSVLGATAKDALVCTRRAAKPSIPETDRILVSGLAAGSPVSPA